MTLAAQNVPHKRIATTRAVITTSVLVLALCNSGCKSLHPPTTTTRTTYRQHLRNPALASPAAWEPPVSRRVPTDGHRTGRVLAGGIGWTSSAPVSNQVVTALRGKRQIEPALNAYSHQTAPLLRDRSLHERMHLQKPTSGDAWIVSLLAAERLTSQ